MACLYDRSESPLLKPTTDAKPARPKSTLRGAFLIPLPLEEGGTKCAAEGRNPIPCHP